VDLQIFLLTHFVVAFVVVFISFNFFYNYYLELVFHTPIHASNIWKLLQKYFKMCFFIFLFIVIVVDNVVPETRNTPNDGALFCSNPIKKHI